MRLTTYKEWLNEAKNLDDTHINATLFSPTHGLKKGDVVKADALQYTKGGDNDKIDVVLPNGKKDSIEKKYLEVKI